MHYPRLLALAFASGVATASPSLAGDGDAHPTTTARDSLLDDLLEQAEQMARSGNYAEAVRRYLRVETELTNRRKKDPHDRPTTEVGPGIDRGVGLYLRDRIRALPADGLRLYRLTIDPRAKLALEAAIATRVPEQIEAVIARYPLSTVVVRALPVLASLSLERGELGRAMRAYARLEALTTDPRLKRKAALLRTYAAVIRRDAAGAKRALAAYTQHGGRPDARRTFGARRSSLTDLVGALRTTAQQPTTARRATFDPGGLARRLTLAYPELPPSLAERLDLPLAYQEALYDPATQLLFVTDAKTVRAVPVSPGARGGWVYSLLDPQSEPSRLEAAALRPALGPGRVFVTLHRNRPAKLVPGKEKDKPDVKRRKDWRVVAVDRRRGRLVWDSAAAPAFERYARGAEWISSPLYHEGAVYVVALERKTDLRATLLRLDAANGKLQSQTFVVSRPAYDYLGMSAPPPAPSVSTEGHIIIGTGLGAVAAIEPTRGEPVWITRYPVVPAASEGALIDAGRRFRPMAPLAKRDPIVVAPVDGASVVALDSRTGRIRWHAPRGRARACLAGPDGQVILVGATVRGLDRANGRIAYQGDPIEAPLAARPAVLGQELVLVTTEGLTRVRLTDGKQLATLRFDRPEREVGPAVSLGALGLATVAPHRVNVYQDLPTRLEAIKTQTVPGPKRQLRIGLLRAQRNELTLAIKALRSALRTRGLDAREALQVRTAGVSLLRREALRRHAQGRTKGFRLAAEHAFAFLGPLGNKPDQEVGRSERALLLTATPLLRLYADVLFDSADPQERAKAAGAFQRLLWTPPGTLVPLTKGGRLKVDATAYARQRLIELVAKHGIQTYAKYETQAKAEYRLAREPLSKTALRSVARNYPASTVAASARWDLARSFANQGLRSRAVRELARFVRDHPKDPRLPEALARLAATHARLQQPAQARRFLAQLTAIDPEPKVQGADMAPSQPARSWARQQQKLLSEGTRAEALARAAATAGLSVPLSLSFRGSTELSQMGRELITVERQGGSDLFLLRRDALIEVRRVPDGELVITIPSVPRTALRPLLLDRLLVIPYRDRLEGYDVSRSRRAQAKPTWRYTISPTLKGVLNRRFALHALYSAPGLALVLTGGNDLIAIGPDGKRRWQVSLPNQANGGLRIDGGRVLSITSFPAQIASISLASGREEWTYKPPVRPGLQARIGNPTWIAPGRLVYVHGGKRLVAIDATKGRELWTSQGKDADWVTEVHASTGGQHLVARQQSGARYGVRVYDAKTGGELWRDNGSGATPKAVPPKPGAAPASISRIVVGADAVYTFRRTNNRTELWAQELAVGRRQWLYRLPAGSQASQLILTPGAVIVPRSGIFSTRATLVVLGRGNGRVVESHALPGRRLLGEGAEPVDGTVVITTEKGLLGYGARDEEALTRETITLARRLNKTPRNASIRTQLASRLGRLNQREAALQLLQEGLLSEGLRATDFDRMFAQLTAISETESESVPAQLSIRGLPRPPEIDGELNDWWRPWSAVDLKSPRNIIPIQQAPGSSPGRWSGREDLSAKLYMGWDEKHFYFALDVTDMNLRPYDSESERWIGDCLLIAIDCKNDGGDVVLSDDVLLSLALTLPKKKDEDEKQQEQEGEKNKPEGKYFVHRKEDNSGAIYEVAVPWSLFVKNGAGINPATGPTKGFQFGFNVVLTDDDGDRFGADDPNNPRGGPRGALKSLELTPGVLLHYQKNRLWRGYIPKRFAKITLE